MDRRALTQTVGRNIDSARAAAGIAPAILAEATDMDASEASAILNGESPATLSELLRVGGFLRIPADHFLRGAVA